MKYFIYSSILSAAIVAGGGYLVYDHQARDRQQAQLQSSFQQRIERVTNSYQDQLNAATAALREASIAALEQASARLNRQVEDRYAQLEKTENEHIAQLKKAAEELEGLCVQTQQDNERTRTQTETQTNHVISVINKLRIDSLRPLYDAQSEIASLKRQH